MEQVLGSTMVLCLFAPEYLTLKGWVLRQQWYLNDKIDSFKVRHVLKKLNNFVTMHNLMLLLTHI